MKLIGICGAIRGGKSTAANMLAELSKDVTLYSFADALKEECATLLPREQLGWTGSDWTGPKTEEGRKLLQNYAETKRIENPNHWLNKVICKLNLEKPKIGVITDVRYCNELNYVNNNGQAILYIKNSYKEKDWLESYCKNEPTARHGSECEWRHWLHCNPYLHYIIHNDSDFIVLKMQLERFLHFEFKNYPVIGI